MFSFGLALFSPSSGIRLTGVIATVTRGSVALGSVQVALSNNLITSSIGTIGGDPSTDPHIANVVLLLHAEGADNSTTFIDNSPKQYLSTVTGNAKISHASSKWGSSSAVFAGGNDRIEYTIGDDLDFGTGDFTIEAWIRSGASANRPVLYYAKPSPGGASDIGWYLFSNLGGLVDFKMCSGATQIISFLSTATIISAYKHWAVSKVGTTIKMFIDGVEQNSDTITLAPNYASNYKLTIGGLSGGDSFAGNIDDLRITKGVGRYSSAFTPRGSAFPDSIDKTARPSGVSATTGVGFTYVDTGVAGNIAVGASNTILAATVDKFATTGLDATNAIFFRSDGSASQADAAVLSISGGTVTKNTDTLIYDTTGVSSIAIDWLTSTKAIEVVCESVAGDMEVRVLTKSGSSISAGTAVTVPTFTSTSQIVVKALSSTSAILVFVGAAGNVNGELLTISGTDVTIDGTFAFSSGISTPQYLALSKISSTQALLSFTNGSANYYAKVLTVSGSSISGGSNMIYSTGGTKDNLSLAVLSSTKAIAAFFNSGTGYQWAVLTISGTTVSINTPTLIASAGVATLNRVNIQRFSDISAVATISSGETGNYLNALYLTAAGTSVTETSEEVVYDVEQIFDTELSQLDATNFITTFYDSIAEEVKSKILTIS